ncbi:MAG: hypothetical protein J4G11_06940 [Acidimicrobiia bacterium]|nr:hypothetical protein [Acidimicrobiia bacterium]
MRAVIGWIIAGTLLAVTVLGAVAAQNVREVATWMVIGVAIAAGLGAMIMSAESAPTHDGAGILLAILRPMLSVAAGVVTLLSTMVAGCNDVGGVPSWKRCHTWLGNPTVDWPGAPLFALALALGVGYLVWSLFGKVFLKRQ